MRDYPHVMSRLINTPLLAHPAKAEMVVAVVLKRAGVTVELGSLPDPAGPSMGPVQERQMRRWAESWGQKPYLFDPTSGTAVIEVTGSLSHRQWYIGESSGVMGYDGIAAQFAAAEEDAGVRRILFDIHSAGGEVAGCFQLADRIAEAKKPTVAVADEMAFSAAYAIASACDEIILASETAQVGSVGVIAVHMSYEQYLRNEGIKPTIIRAGARKAEGNPLEDLAPDVRKRWQAEIDAINDLFVARVAQWRGMSEAAVRATQADCFMGRAALRVGFADEIASPQEIFAAFAA